MVQAFRNVLKRANPRQPRRFQTDRGKEFYNAPFSRFLKEKDIHHFSTLGNAKAAIVERFNRTLKGRMYRYFTAANTLKYIDVLQDLVDGYNSTYHRSIGMAPKEVVKKQEEKIWMRMFGGKKKESKPIFKVGDRVRLSKAARTFKKGYLPDWTEEVFIIRQVDTTNPETYKVSEFDGTAVKGSFYRQELQKVKVADDTLWRIEKVLKRRGDQLYVQWKGWPTKYNSWIHKRDVRK